MKKRIFSFIMSFIILTLTVFSVSAVQPRWSYTNSVQFYLYFDDSEGIISGSIDAYDDVTKIEGTITVYKKNILGLWSKTGDEWDISTSSNYLLFEEYFNAESGKKYKAELDVDVYSGSNSENITDTATGTCP